MVTGLSVNMPVSYCNKFFLLSLYLLFYLFTPYKSLEQNENVAFPFGKRSVSTQGGACSIRNEFSIVLYKLYFISYTTVMPWIEHWMQSQVVGFGFFYISSLFVVRFMKDRDDVVQFGE